MSVVSLEDRGGGQAGEVVEIDRCDQCGGTFLDFFDGEPIGIARDALEDAPARRAQAPERPATCPDCDRAMVDRPYLDDGPMLARCDTCMAVFVSGERLEALAAARVKPLDEEAPSWLQRLRALFG